jgi:aryl-alcohol dehydrogenase-like predicted oxidoreductase
MAEYIKRKIMSFKFNPSKTTLLGSNNIRVSRIGIGTNRWAKGSNDEEVYKVYKTLLDKGLNFFDTAEIYTGGKSEQLLGDCIKRYGRPSVIASKYRPNESRRTKKDFANALNGSLRRLGVESLDLYYVHFPPSAQSIEDLMDYMVEAKDEGKIRSIGVSNFDADQMKRAAERLMVHGLKLAANQVEYSLFNRDPEINGVFEACKGLNVSLVAYRPLARGKLTSEGIGRSLSGDMHVQSNLEKVLTSISRDHGGSVGQVALNWLLCKDVLVIPIPGATKVDHVVENAGALEWEMSKSEFNELEEAFS